MFILSLCSFCLYVLLHSDDSFVLFIINEMFNQIKVLVQMWILEWAVFFQQAHFSTFLCKCRRVEATCRQTYCHVNTCVDMTVIEIFVVTYCNVSFTTCRNQPTSWSLLMLLATQTKEARRNLFSLHCHAGTWQHVCKTRIQTWNPRENFQKIFQHIQPCQGGCW